MSGIKYGNEIIGNVISHGLYKLENIIIIDQDNINKKEEIGNMNYDGQDYILYKFPKDKIGTFNKSLELQHNDLFYQSPSTFTYPTKETEKNKYKEILNLYEKKVQEILDFGSVYLLTNIAGQILSGGYSLNDSIKKDLTLKQKNDILKICINEKKFNECHNTLVDITGKIPIIRQKESGPRKILIIGGGPVGLLTAYMFKKKLGDSISVIILENRITEDGTRKDFERIQTMRMPSDIWNYLPESIMNEFKRLRLGIDLHKKDITKRTNQQVLPIMLIEKLLLDEISKQNVVFRYTKEFQSVDKIKGFVKNNNIDIVIDASGGRLESDTGEQLVKLSNEPKIDWYQPLVGYLMANFQHKYTLGVRNPSHMEEDFKNISTEILNMFLYFYQRIYHMKPTHLEILIKNTIVKIEEMKDKSYGIDYEIGKKNDGVGEKKDAVVCRLYIIVPLLSSHVIIYVPHLIEYFPTLKLYDYYERLYYEDIKLINHKYEPLNERYTPRAEHESTEPYKPTQNSQQKYISNITYYPSDNFYYYTKLDTNPADYQFGYITLHGKLIGTDRLYLENNFDYNKTHDWLTSCGIDWDTNKIIVDPIDIIDLENFTENDKNIPNNFPYKDVYDYLAISLNKTEYNQIKTLWKGSYKTYAETLQIFNQLKDTDGNLWLINKINDIINKFYTHHNKSAISFNNFNDTKYDFKVAPPFEIKPGFRNKSASTKVFSDNDDVLYVMTGDALFQPHFYGTGGFRRGAEVSNNLVELIFEHFFGTKIDATITDTTITDIVSKSDVLINYNKLDDYISDINKYINVDKLKIIKCLEESFGLNDFTFAKGTDPTKIVLLSKFKLDGIQTPLKIAIKFYITNKSTNPKEIEYMNKIKLYGKNQRYFDTFLITDNCINTGHIFKKILENNCTDNNNVCSKTLRNKMLDTDNIYYIITKTSEYGSIQNIINNNGKISALTHNGFEIINLYDTEYIILLVFNIIWQMYLLSNIKIFHGDLIPDNILIYVDEEYPKKEEYYNYTINSINFSIRKMPIIFKLGDFGKSIFYENKTIDECMDLNIKHMAKSVFSFNKIYNNIKDLQDDLKDDLNDLQYDYSSNKLYKFMKKYADKSTYVKINK